MEAETRVTDQHSAPLLRRRILYALGPGDVVGLYRDLSEGREPAFQMGMPFSKQFLDWCDEVGADAHAISCNTRRDSIQVGRHRLENRPKSPLFFKSGVKFYIGNLLYGLAIVAQAIRDRATLAIVDSGTSQWIVFSLLYLMHIPVIAVMHNTFWPADYPPKRMRDRFLRALDRFFFRHIAAATVCVSPECERQLHQLAGTTKGPIYQFRPQYREGFLSHLNAPPQHPIQPFRVLFMGRVESYKGVFLMLQMAERLEAEMPGRFEWRIVGSGGASEELKRAIEERKLGKFVEAPGMLPDERNALETFAWCHAMVVPTTSGFFEGLAMSAAESVLSGRPVVVTSVVPAWEVLGDAAIKVETDNLESLIDAFCKLAQNPELYDKCQRATAGVQAQFYDRSNGLGNTLGRAIMNLK
jgi:glycogen synthase